MWLHWLLKCIKLINILRFIRGKISVFYRKKIFQIVITMENVVSLHVCPNIID